MRNFSPFFPQRLLSVLLSLSLCLLTAATAWVQTPNIGIGTITPHESAMLEIASSSRGMLVPRLDSAQRVNISNPATGLLVYQTNGKQPGFWYNAGTPTASSWQRIATGSSSGSTGTSTGTGTTIEMFNSGSTVNPCIYRGNKSDSRTIIVYKASDLRAAGVRPGLIRGVQFRVRVKRSTQPYRNLSITLEGTYAGSPTEHGDMRSPTNYAADYSTVLDWNTHAFTVPFNWNGSSNIAIQVCFDNDSPGVSDDVRVVQGQSYDSFTSRYPNSGTTNLPGCNLTKTASNGIDAIKSTSIPAIRFMQ